MCVTKNSRYIILKPRRKKEKKNEKMSRTILELFLPFRLFKKTANIRWTTTSAQILNFRSVSHVKTIQNGGLLRREKQTHNTLCPANSYNVNLRRTRLKLNKDVIKLHKKKEKKRNTDNNIQKEAPYI